MSEKRIVDNDLHDAVVALQRHMKAHAPDKAFDVVLTIRVDGRASIERLCSRGRLIGRSRRFHTRETKASDEWLEHVPDSPESPDGSGGEE